MLYLIIIIFEIFICTTRECELTGIQNKEDSSHCVKDINLELITDFNYNEFSLVNVKMPFINYNRNKLIKARTDITDMYIYGCEDFIDNFLMNIDKTLSRIATISNIMRCTLNSEDINKVFHHYDSGFENIEIMNYFLKNLFPLLSIDNAHITHLKEIIYILEHFDKYIFDVLGVDLYIFELKPSEILRAFIDDRHPNTIEIKAILFKLLCAYDSIMNCLIWFKGIVLDFNNPNFFVNRNIPFIISIDILIKWIIYVQKTNIVAEMKNELLKKPQQIIIYSINANKLALEMSSIIDLLIIEMPIEELIKHKIKKILMQNELFSTTKFEAYDVVIMDKKYIIKKYTLNKIAGIPSGISTAYLNVNNDFESIGYLGFAESTYIYSFFSIEEEPDTFIKISNFVYFESNEDQILYFILDFLHVLDQLKLYNIKLMSQSILFAVVKSSKRWRFRVDDIGQFCYINKPNLYENHIFIVSVLEKLLLFINNKNTFNFVRDLCLEANLLRNDEYDYYIEILILKVEKKINSL